MSIRILFLGETVGRPGIEALKKALKDLKEEAKVDFVVANGEGATGGFGIGKNHALQLLNLGINVITTGEKTYYKKEMVEHIATNSRILRPANYPAKNPGRGFRVFKVGETRVAIITLLGNSDFPRTHLANPFIAVSSIIEKIKSDSDAIVVQFHASTTAEKQTMAAYLDGKVAAVIGTHSKILTADAKILEHKTAMITDNGRCGSALSVGGFESKTEIERFITQVPSRSLEVYDNLELQGVIVEIDEFGKAQNIETIRHPVAYEKGLKSS
ncbi:MAG: TIGR00282 family metallophosphoesterase [Sphaerochaetaceae bacterium]|nr:YmdB family metallophosphoesterase [Candidatus Cloacimonadota bacterium]